MGPHFHSTFIITGKILLIARIYFTYKPAVHKRLEGKTKTILFATPLLAMPPPWGSLVKKLPFLESCW